MSVKYLYIELFARFFLVLGGINYLFMSMFKNNLSTLITNKNILKALYLLIGISALLLITNRDYYLPFLGKCAIPLVSKSLAYSTSVKKFTITNLPPNVKVIYWATKPNKDSNSNYIEAYDDYSNSGVSQTDKNGSVVIELDCPSEYTVPKFGIFNKKLKKHIHYRYQLPQSNGLLSRVFTQYVMC